MHAQLRAAEAGRAGLAPPPTDAMDATDDARRPPSGSDRRYSGRALLLAGVAGLLLGGSVSALAPWQRALASLSFEAVVGSAPRLAAPVPVVDVDAGGAIRLKFDAQLRPLPQRAY